MENKKSYECMIVLDAKLSEAKRDELIARFKKMAGEDTTVEKMGQKKYPHEQRRGEIPAQAALIPACAVFVYIRHSICY